MLNFKLIATNTHTLEGKETQKAVLKLYLSRRVLSQKVLPKLKIKELKQYSEFKT